MSRTRFRVVVTSLALASLLTALPAAAVVVTGGFSGQIFSGSDFGSAPGGFFGAGPDLVDLPITGTFRYDTSLVPPASNVSANSATYTDPTFSTDFLQMTVTINGHTYAFGGLAGSPPGIQSIDVIDNTDQLQIDYQRFGIGAQEAITLRFISDIDFLTGIGVPTQFDFVASGIGLTPGGSFSFDLGNDFASASFSIDTGFAVAAVPEPAVVASLLPGLLAIGALCRRRAGRSARNAAVEAARS